MIDSYLLQTRVHACHNIPNGGIRIKRRNVSGKSNLNLQADVSTVTLRYVMCRRGLRSGGRSPAGGRQRSEGVGRGERAVQGHCGRPRAACPARPGPARLSCKSAVYHLQPYQLTAFSVRSVFCVLWFVWFVVHKASSSSSSSCEIVRCRSNAGWSLSSSAVC